VLLLWDGGAVPARCWAAPAYSWFYSWLEGMLLQFACLDIAALPGAGALCVAVSVDDLSLP
jgi:hypothetical protein